MSQLSETFWITFTTMGFAFLTGSLAYAFKSKCSRVKCLGCLEIERDIEAELEDEIPVQLPQTSNLSVIEPPLTVQPARRLSSSSTRRDSMDVKIAEALQRFQSIHALNVPSPVLTRANSFTS
jgi:hypothetical protein